MARIFGWIKREIIHIIPAIIYFCIIFNFIHFTSGLMLAPGEHRHYTYLSVTISAIVMGKILIIIDSLPLTDLFPNKPLIYNIVWKLFFYSTFVMLFRMAELALHLFIFHHKNVNAVYHILLTEICSPIFWSAQMIIILALTGFIVFTEITNKIGADKMKRMLFGL